MGIGHDDGVWFVWQGHPIYIQHMGRVDMARIREVSTDERTVKYHIQEYERCIKVIFPICSRLKGRQIDQSFAIMDVKGGVPALISDYY